MSFQGFIMEKEQCDLKQMQRVTAPKAANSGMCALVMGAWVAGRKGPQLIGPQVSRAYGKQVNKEKRKSISPSAHHTKAKKNSLCLPRDKSLSTQQDERRETFGDISIQVHCKERCSSFLWLRRVAALTSRPFPPEAQAPDPCEPVPLTAPCLACTSPPLILLHLSITKIPAQKEGTHVTKHFQPHTGTKQLPEATAGV